MRMPLLGTRTLRALPPQLVMVASFGFTSIINYFFGLALGWLLLPQQYGLVSFAQTVILLAALVLNSGFAWSLTNRLAQPNLEERDAYLRGAYISNLALALVLAALILVLYHVGILRSGLETLPMALIVAGMLPFLAVIAIANGSFRGLQAFGDLGFNQVLEIACKALAGLLFVSLGWGAVGAIGGFLVGGVVASLAGLWRSLRLANTPLVGRVRWLTVRTTLGMFAALLGMALLLNVDIVLLKTVYRGDVNVPGYYQAAIMLANTPYYLTSALLAVLFPRLAQVGTLAASGSHVGNTLKLILLIVLPFEALLLLLPDVILTLVFPDAYGVAAVPLRILAVGNTMLILLALLATAFQAVNRPLLSGAILAVVLTAEVIGLLVLVPVYGGVGAALCFAAAAAAAALVHAVVYLKRVDPIDMAAVRRWALRYTVAAAAAAATLYVGLLLKNVLIALLLTGTVYVVALVLLDLVPLPGAPSSLKFSARANKPS